MPGEAGGAPLLDLRLAACLAGDLHQLLSIPLLRLGPATTNPGAPVLSMAAARGSPSDGRSWITGSAGVGLWPCAFLLETVKPPALPLNKCWLNSSTSDGTSDTFAHLGEGPGWEKQGNHTPDFLEQGWPASGQAGLGAPSPPGAHLCLRSSSTSLHIFLPSSSRCSNTS